MVVVLVIAVTASKCTLGTVYTPTDIIWVSIGRIAPIAG